MKKRILSVLCVLCLIVGLLPTTAMAAGTSTAPEKIYICGMELTDGKCLVDNNATVTDYISGDYVALYKDGVLYLNGLNKTYAGIANGYRTLNWDYSHSGAHDLVIELVEGSVNTLVDTNYGAINGASGTGSNGPSLTIQGKGTLNVTGGTYAIWVWENVTIQNGATVNANGGTQSGISINSTSGAITVKQGTTVTTSGTYGISGSNNHTVNFNIEGGNLVVKGTTQALYNTVASIDNAIDVYVSGMSDPTQASDVTTWNKTDNLVSNNYKYISLSGFSSTVTTYDVTKAATSNGSFEIDCPDKSMAAETVTITATPNTGYEVDTVTVTDAGEGTVSVSGAGNTRTFTMPEENVTIAVTFKPTTYTITYNLDEGTNASGNPATYTVETDDITLEAPSKSGYTFGGWFENSGFTGSAVTTIAKGSTGNKTLYAKWTENQVTGTTYTYAYDAQRTPAFPDSVGAEITAKSFSAPLKNGSVSPTATRYDSNQGVWTLTEEGYYSEKSSFDPAPTEYLDGVVTAVANKYGLDTDGKNGLMIHKLTDAEGNHVGYGVVIAVDETNGYALFIGDLWNSSGAGYLLSENVISATSVTFNTQQMAQSKYSISLSPTTVTFAEVQTGYTVPAAQTITVTNTGDDATGELSVTLSGGNSSNFILSSSSINSINDTATFTVVPKNNLEAGTYTETITVKGEKVMPVTTTVSFTVTAPTTYNVEVQTDGHGTASATPTSGAKDTEITLTATPSIGYKFKEWQVVTNNVTITDDKFNMPASDVTVKAIFEKETYTISWDTDGDGDVDDTTNVAYGDTPTHADGSKTENAQYTYTFTGWTPEITAATGAVTYEAQFTPVTRSYDVTLDAQGGTGAPESITVTYGGSYSGLVNPTRPSYTFTGWFTAAEGGTAVTNSTTVSITGPQTLYAHWTLKSDAELEDVTFTHAYDVQRIPAFPAKGDTITLSGFQYPLDANGTHGTTNEGVWTLTEVGAYYTVKNTASDYLKSVVNGIAGNYTGITADEIVIHELKNGSTHVAYGVVVAYDAASGRAVFLGDTWSGGAGYLLSTGTQTDSTDMTATAVPTDFVQAADYRITLDKTGTYTFTAATAGYAAQSPVTITVTNAGSAATGELTVALSGTNADSFALSKSSITEIAVSGSDTFTVVPNTGLAAGTYTATVTVSGTNVVPKSFNVTFTVNAITVTFDANGGTVSPTSSTTGADGKLSSLPAPARDGYTFRGWFDAATGGSEVTVSTVFTGNKTIYAQWTEKSVPTPPAPPIYIPPVHTCTSKCEVCGKCMDTTCTKSVCTDKCNGDENVFTDVAEDAWYAEAVKYVYHRGMMEGVGNGLFDINGTTTRAMIVTILWRLEGEPVVNYLMQFDDIPADTWYTEAVRWAASEKIVEGWNGKFDPMGEITREQFATILWRYAKSKGYDVSVGEDTNILSYEDAFSVSEYAIPAMQWACGAGLMQGDGANLTPKADATRAQAAALFQRFCENVADK